MPGYADGAAPAAAAAATALWLRRNAAERQPNPLRVVALGGSAAELPVSDRQAVMQRVEDLIQFRLRDHQRRRNEQRRLLAAGGDQGAGFQRLRRHPARERFGLLTSPIPPVGAVQFHGPVRSEEHTSELQS